MFVQVSNIAKNSFFTSSHPADARGRKVALQRNWNEKKVIAVCDDLFEVEVVGFTFSVAPFLCRLVHLSLF